MRFKVTWTPSAEADLARIWLAARDRERLTEVSARIEEGLARSPTSAGESREPGVRLIFDDPLWVEFETDQSARTVRILTVWRYSR